MIPPMNTFSINKNTLYIIPRSITSRAIATYYACVYGWRRRQVTYDEVSSQVCGQNKKERKKERKGRTDRIMFYIYQKHENTIDLKIFTRGTILSPSLYLVEMLCT